MARDQLQQVTVTLIDGDVSVADLCKACELTGDAIEEMIAYGIIEPGQSVTTGRRFPAVTLRRVARVVRLQRDLEVNLAGAAVAVELLEEIERLRARLRVLEGTD